MSCFNGMLDLTSPGIINDQTYLDYYYRLIEIGLNMFEWKNVPDTVDPRYLEMALISDGMAVFFYDEVLGFLTLQVRIGGQLDVYRIPKYRTAYSVGNGGYNRNLDEADSVIIFNNYMRSNSLFPIINYSRRLYEVQRAIDININAQKTPILLRAAESQRLTLKNVYNQYTGNEPVIFGDKNIDTHALEVLKTDAPFLADKLQALKKAIWQEALTFLGVESSVDKKERLIDSEMSASLGDVEAQRYTRLNARRQAAEKINAMFGLNVEVDFRDTVSRETIKTEEGTETITEGEVAYE